MIGSSTKARLRSRVSTGKGFSAKAPEGFEDPGTRCTSGGSKCDV